MVEKRRCFLISFNNRIMRSQMYFVQVIVFALLIRSTDNVDSKTLSNGINSCLSRSLKRVFLENEHEKFDCSSVPSKIQSILALHFSFCHLNSTGIDPKTICSLSSFDRNIRGCLRNVTKNSFAYLTYTNFVPHIQSICYALETQQWHSHLRDTVSHINMHSNQIEAETKRLLFEQATMQNSCDQALAVNQRSVNDALSIDKFLQAAQSDVDELRAHLYVKDKAQIELIQQVTSIEY